MNSRLCIIACTTLAPEISHLLQSGSYPDVKLLSYPSFCVGGRVTNELINQLIGEDNKQYSKILVVVSTCAGLTNWTNQLNKKIEVIRLEQCFEIILNLPTIYHFIKQGYYLVSNGWLRNYHHHVREWGFEKDSAKKFFRESIKKILFLDTQLPGDYQQNLHALSSYMGLSYDILPIGMNHLQRFIDSIVYEWRNEEQRKIQNDRISALARESADFHLVFNLLRNLLICTEEDVIVKELTNLLNILFAPKAIDFHPYNRSDQSFLDLANPEVDEFGSSNSIRIKIHHQEDILGFFDVIKVQFPSFIEQYKPMAKLVSLIGGLAISNARKFGELEQTRKALTISEEHFRTIFEQAPLGIALINSLNGQILTLNSKFASIAGRTEDELRSIDWMSITHPDDIQEDLDNMSDLNTGKINGFQMNKRYLKPDGAVVWINMTIAPVKVEYNSNPFHLCMIEDISIRKEAEILLKASEANLKELNNAKDKFFSVLSHDLKSPFTSIVSLAGLMSSNEYDLPVDEMRQLSGALHRTAQSTHLLLEDLLEWARLQRNAMPFNPGKINLGRFFERFRELVEEIAEQKSVDIEINYLIDLEIIADEYMLKSILRNLVTNAIKFTKPGGKIAITAKEEFKDQVLFIVQDNGIGMTQALINDLFTIGKQVSRPGTGNEPSSGLGLIVCKEFVEKHKGRIWVESEVGVGSKFYFTINHTQ